MTHYPGTARRQSRIGLCYAHSERQQRRLAAKLTNFAGGESLSESPSYSDLVVRAFFLFLFICAMIFTVSQLMSALV